MSKNQLTQSTKSIKEEDIKREWHLIDLSGRVLGRAIPDISKFLQGKNKIKYVPYLDMGDYVVVINAKKVVLTGKKSSNKVYSYFSGYPGGLRQVKFEEMIEKNPGEVIRHAVSGMLPKNKLRKKRLARLFIFPDEKNPYQDKFPMK